MSSLVSFIQSRATTEIYIKELAKNLCGLYYPWVQGTFKHTLTAALEALSMTREDP